MKPLVVIPVLALLLVGCAHSKVDNYTNAAVRACGKDGVAWVNVQEGRFGCKRGSFSRDH